MTTFKKIILGETTEAAIKLLFDNRIAQESSDESTALNVMNRSMTIKDLKTQVLSFIKNNPNSSYKLIVPEFNSDKKLELLFTNYSYLNDEDEDKVSEYEIVVDEAFNECNIKHKSLLGEPVKLRLTAQIRIK